MTKITTRFLPWAEIDQKENFLKFLKAIYTISARFGTGEEGQQAYNHLAIGL